MKRDEIVIEAGRTEGQYWRDIWRYRELFYFLAWRDLLIRYKQTVFGVAWALVRPVLTTVILTFAFGQVANLSSGTVPYALFVFAAQLPWQFFSNAVSESSASLLTNSHLVTKVYFPRLIIPSSSLIPSFVDLAISAALLAVMMAWYGVAPGWGVLLVPAFTLLAFAAALGLGLWLSALTVKYRDFRFVTTFILQFGLYVSPVGFASTYVPERWRLVYALNPMAGVIDGFRWSLFGEACPMNWAGLLVSVGVTAFLVFTGVYHFRRTERSFADTI